MKITIFRSNGGDCLLITGEDNKRLLIDGGMSGSFRDHVAKTLGELRDQDQKIDLVCVSHIDSDHIGGILGMLDDEAAWRVHKFQHEVAGNEEFKEPKAPRPPELGAIWYNSFETQVGGQREDITSALAINTKVLNLHPNAIGQEFANIGEHSTNLMTGVKQGILLSNRISDGQLKIPLNREFASGLISLNEDEDPPAPVKLGNMSITVIAPFKQDLDNLQDEWKKWVKEHQEVVEELQSDATMNFDEQLDDGDVAAFFKNIASKLGDRDLVTVPNLASIMLLVEEDGKTILLTGDGHGKDIRKGLKHQGKLDPEGKLHVDVIKVPHHGSEHNTDDDFWETITADHYIISANGSHENPDIRVLKALINGRLSAMPDLPFKLWFNSSVKICGTEKREEHMQKVENLIEQEMDKHGSKLKSRFLRRGSRIEFSI